MFKRIYQSQIARGSLLIFIANTSVNFGNFLYNLLMARLLGKADYGVLGSLLSLLVIVGLPLSILNLHLIKAVSAYSGVGKIGKIKSLYQDLSWKFLGFGLLVTIILLVLTPLLTGFLHLDNMVPLILIAVFSSAGGISVLYNSILNGLLAFGYLAFNGIGEIIVKLVSSVALTFYFGFIGAVIGSALGGIFRLAAGILELKSIFRKTVREKSRFALLNLKDIMPVVVATLILNSIINIDIILVRHFFPDAVSGEYVALSTVSKIIFYATTPLITIMFPYISKKKAAREPYILALFTGLTFALFISLIVIFIFSFFPETIIGLLFGKEFLKIISHLVHFGFFIVFYNLNAILTFFFLSVSYNRILYFLLFFPLLQVVLLAMFHQDLTQIINVNIIINLFYLFFALIYLYRRESEEIYSIIRKIRAYTIHV